MFSKLIKKVFSYGVLKIVDFEKGELLANDGYISRYMGEIEIVCNADHADYIMKILGEVHRVLSILEVHFSDHIKIVYHHTEKFDSAFVASTICIKDLEAWKGAAEEEQDRLIKNLVCRTLLAKEFQENKKFTGMGLISRYTRKRSKKLAKQAEEMVYQRSLFLLKKDWADIVVSEANPVGSVSLSNGGLAEMYFEMEDLGALNSTDTDQRDTLDL